MTFNIPESDSFDETPILPDSYTLALRLTATRIDVLNKPENQKLFQLSSAKVTAHSRTDAECFDSVAVLCTEHRRIQVSTTLWTIYTMMCTVPAVPCRADQIDEF